MPRAGVRGGAVLERHLLGGVRVAKQFCGLAGAAPGRSPHTARRFSITKSPGATSRTSGPTASTSPAASWASRRGNWSLMPPSVVVQVGLAPPARLDLDQRPRRARGRAPGSFRR